MRTLSTLTLVVSIFGAGTSRAQVSAVGTPQPSAGAPAAARAAVAPVVAPVPPADYVIGAEDLLSVVFWREKDMSSEVAVRPDGKISLPLLNDVQAAGLTPTQLRDQLTEGAKQYVADPNVTVVVRQINSRKVYITGQVNKPGPYTLGAATTILQLIATAGGVMEYAHSDKIIVMRTENGKQLSYPFDYKAVVARKNLKQNIELKPGDTVIVP
jgi:polysaccharide export outer membrane protein